MERYKSGASYGTLNATRSTITLISSYSIHKDGLISRFLKGTFKECTHKTQVHHHVGYDSDVLRLLENLHPLKKLKLKEATEKVSTLLALATAHRLQTLTLISINNISISDSEISIKIPDLIKISKPGSFPPELILPFFKEKPGLCVASVILEYLEITKNLRTKNNKKLLISMVKPHNNASSQTIGHWIKSLLTKAGIETKQFSAYSTRHAAVSAAFKNGVNIDTIRRTAGWSSGSQMFKKFYNKPIVSSKDKFARSLILKN